MSELTESQARFVKEYLIDLNGGKAATRAGYSKETAISQASRLLRNVHVYEAVQAGLKKRGDKMDIKAERVIAELVRVAFSDLKQIASWDGKGIVYTPSEDLDDDTSAAVQEITDKTSTTSITKGGETSETTRREQRVKLHDKIRALELLSRHLGILEKSDPEAAKTLHLNITTHEARAAAVKALAEDPLMQPPGPPAKVEPL